MSVHIYIPITKVDAAQRVVYGTFTEESHDRANEIMDYATSKPNFEHWSNEVYKASGGRSYGNVRAMHKAVGAGIITQPIEFNDDSKVMKALTRIIDNDEWEKVEAGVYTGFSVGGTYTKRWQDPANPGVTRYTAMPSEISLVDLPCVKGATFEFVKEGATNEASEQRLFKSVVDSPDQIDYSTLPAIEEPKSGLSLLESVGAVPVDFSTITSATTPTPVTSSAPQELSEVEKLRKRIAELETSGTGTGTGTGTAPKVVYKATDGSYFEDAASCIAHNATLETNAAVADITASADEALGKLNALLNNEPAQTPRAQTPGASVTVVEQPAKKVPAVYGKRHMQGLAGDATQEVRNQAFSKGMYDISRIASLLCELKWCYDCMVMEEAAENDDSANPGKAAAIITAMVDLLTSVVAEETTELLTTVRGDCGDDDDDDDDDSGAGPTYVILAASAMPLNLLKGLLDCGVPLKKGVAKAITNQVASLEKSQQLNKTFGLTFTEADLRPDNLDLPQAVRLVLVKNSGLETKVTQYGDQLTKLAKRVEELAAEPLPMKGKNFSIVTKAQDAARATGSGISDSDAHLTPDQALAKALQGIPPEQRANALMKFALANPTLSIP
jgi:hypothetical protein